LLEAVRAGREDAADELMELVYEELRRLARGKMAGVPPGDTLQPTALVHEAYLRLFRKDNVGWPDRGHFFKAAARAMRDIVVDEARKHLRLKRGGDRRRLTLEEAITSVEAQPEDLVALNECLEQLAARDRISGEVVMLRYFAGLTIEETARALDISPSTVDRHWRFARAWLSSRIHGGSAGSEGEARA
jgi:RNA polymerase sigma factor (TIGR02999 family)